MSTPLPPLPYVPLDYMDAYLEQMEGSREYIRKVRLSFKHLAAHLRTQGIEHDPAEVMPKHIDAFNQWVRDQDWSPGYRKQVLDYTRPWFKWLAEQGIILADPGADVSRHHERHEPVTLSAKDVARLFQAHTRTALATSPLDWHRRDVVLWGLVRWGLSSQELQALNATDVQLNRSVIRTPEKEIPYTASMKRVIRRWLQVRSQHPHDEALLTQYGGTRITHRSIYELMSKLGQLANIELRLTDPTSPIEIARDEVTEQLQELLTFHRTSKHSPNEGGR